MKKNFQLKWHDLGTVPAKADAGEQTRFLEEDSRPRWKRSGLGKGSCCSSTRPTTPMGRSWATCTVCIGTGITAKIRGGFTTAYGTGTGTSQRPNQAAQEQTGRHDKFLAL